MPQVIDRPTAFINALPPQAVAAHAFGATLINYFTRDEICIDVLCESDRFCAVLVEIRRTYSAEEWGVFETWEIDS